MVFAGTFTAGGLEIAVQDGEVRIVSEGRSRKFVGQVQQNTFSGPYAVGRSQPVLYVTERCVFQLTPEGLELVEVALPTERLDGREQDLRIAILGGSAVEADARRGTDGPVSLERLAEDLFAVRDEENALELGAVTVERTQPGRAGDLGVAQ